MPGSNNKKIIGYRVEYHIEDGKGYSPNEWKKFISNVKNTKVNIKKSYYVHHKMIEIIVDSLKTASEIVKKLKEYGIKSIKVSDFEPIYSDIKESVNNEYKKLLESIIDIKKTYEKLKKTIVY